MLLGNRCYYGLRDLLQLKRLNKGTKYKIYKTLIRPVVLYGSLSWTLTKADEEKLRTFERTILRIFGPRCENGVRRIKYNDELYGFYRDLDIVRVIKVARLRWLGNLVRMEENSLCKKINFSEPEGCRKEGRPKLRWLDSVLKDIKLLKVETCLKKAHDRNIWGRIIKEAMVHKGL
jgi:hypothetical protein